MTASPTAEDPPPPSLGSRAVRGSLWSVLSTSVMLPVNLATGVVLARLLGPAEFGQFVILTTFLAIFVPFLDLGFGASLLQWAGAAAGRGDRPAMDRLFRQNLGMQLLLPLPLTFLVGVFILRDAPGAVQALFLSSVVVGAVVGPGLTRLVVDNRTATTARLGLAAGLLSSGVAVVLALMGASAETLWACRAAVPLLPAAGALFLLAPAERRSLLVPSLPRHMPSGFWLFARGSWIAAGLGALVGNRSEAFLLQLNDLDVAVGIFAVAFGLATQITAPLDLLQANFGPAATALAGRDPGALLDANRRGLAVFGIGSAVVLSLSPVAVALVPLVYGSEYASARTLLVPLLLASCLQTALAPFAVMAVVRRRRRLLPRVQAVTAVADLGLAAVLIPFVGVAGAVAGACVGLVVSSTAMAWAELRSPPQVLRSVLRSGYVEAAVAFGVGLAVLRAVDGPVAQALLGGVTAAAVFCCLMLVLKRTLLADTLVDVGHVLPQRWSDLTERAERRLRPVSDR